MSGPFSFAAAAAFPDRIKAAASLYGVRLFTDHPQSPHRDVEKINAELYFACAETDDWAPSEMVDGLKAHLAASAVRHEVEWYP